MNHFKQYLEDLGILEEFIKVATKETDFVRHRWYNRIEYGDDVLVGNILYYRQARTISDVEWQDVMENYRFPRVPHSELLEIMSDINTTRPSLFRHRIKE